MVVFVESEFLHASLHLLLFDLSQQCKSETILSYFTSWIRVQNGIFKTLTFVQIGDGGDFGEVLDTI